MDEALVKLDNNLVWDGIRQPFYELYYLKINGADGQWALWLRYTFTTPHPENPNGLASLQAIYTHKNGERIALEDKFDMATHEVIHSDQFIRIGEASLSLADCHGGLVGDKTAIKWELAFEDPVVSLRQFPHTFLYESPFPPLKIVAPRLLGFVTGTIYVGHKRIRLLRDRVHQGHMFGTGFVNTLVWANCIDFREDSEAYFEAVSLRLPVAGRPSGPYALFTVGMEGERYQANSLLKMLWQNRSEYDFESWSATFEKRGYRFEILIRRSPEDTVGLRHIGPNGEERFGYTSLLADIEIKVFKRRRGAWQDYKRLTATGKCAFETLSTEMRPDTPLLLG